MIRQFLIRLFNTFAKSFIVNVRLGSKYTSLFGDDLMPEISDFIFSCKLSINFLDLKEVPTLNKSFPKFSNSFSCYSWYFNLNWSVLYFTASLLFHYHLTPSCIMLKNCQTYSKNLAVFSSQDFKSIFGNFSTLCIMKALRKNVLSNAYAWSAFLFFWLTVTGSICAMILHCLSVYVSIAYLAEYLSV